MAEKVTVNSQMAFSSGVEVVTDDFVAQMGLVPVKVEPPDEEPIEPQIEFHPRLEKEEIITDDVPHQMNLTPIPMKLVEAATGKQIQCQPGVSNADCTGEADASSNQEPLVVIKQEPDENVSDDDDDDCSHEMPYCPTELVQTSFGTYDMPEVDISLVRWKWKMRRILRESPTKVNAKKDDLTERQQGENYYTDGRVRKRKSKHRSGESEKDIPDEAQETLPKTRECSRESLDASPDEMDKQLTSDRPRVNRIIISAKKSTKGKGSKTWECFEVETLDGSADEMSTPSGGCEMELDGEKGTPPCRTEAELSAGTSVVPPSCTEAELSAGTSVVPPSCTEAELSAGTPRGMDRVLGVSVDKPPGEGRVEAEGGRASRLSSDKQKKAENAREKEEVLVKDKERSAEQKRNGNQKELGFGLKRLSVCVAKLTNKEIDEARNVILEQGRGRKRKKADEESTEEGNKDASVTQVSPYFQRKRAVKMSEGAEEEKNQILQNRKNVDRKMPVEREEENDQRLEKLRGKGRNIKRSDVSEGDAEEGKKKTLNNRRGKRSDRDIPEEDENGNGQMLNKPKGKTRDAKRPEETSEGKVGEEKNLILDKLRGKKMDTKISEKEEVEPVKGQSLERLRGKGREGGVSEEVCEPAKSERDQRLENRRGRTRNSKKPEEKSEEAGEEKHPKLENPRGKTRDLKMPEEDRENVKGVRLEKLRGKGRDGKRQEKAKLEDDQILEEMPEEIDAEKDQGSECLKGNTKDRTKPEESTEEEAEEKKSQRLEQLRSKGGDGKKSEEEMSLEVADDKMNQTAKNLSGRKGDRKNPDEMLGEEAEEKKDQISDDLSGKGRNRKNSEEMSEEEEEEAGDSKNPTLGNVRGNRRGRRKGETPEARRERLLKAKEARCNETPEEKRRRLEFFKNCQKKYLARESEEQRRRRLEKMKQYQAKRLANESPEDREKRLMRARQYVSELYKKKKKGRKGLGLKLDFGEGRDEETAASSGEAAEGDAADEKVDAVAEKEKTVASCDASVGKSEVDSGELDEGDTAVDKCVEEPVSSREETDKKVADDGDMKETSSRNKDAAKSDSLVTGSVEEAVRNKEEGITKARKCPGGKLGEDCPDGTDEQLTSDRQRVKRLVISAKRSTEGNGTKTWNVKNDAVGGKGEETGLNSKDTAKSDYFVNRGCEEDISNVEASVKCKSFGRKDEKARLKNTETVKSGLAVEEAVSKDKGMVRDDAVVEKKVSDGEGMAESGRNAEGNASNSEAIIKNVSANRDVGVITKSSARVDRVAEDSEMNVEEMVKSGFFDRVVEEAVLGDSEGPSSDLVEDSVCNSDELIKSDVVEWQIRGNGMNMEGLGKNDDDDWDSEGSEYSESE